MHGVFGFGLLPRHQPLNWLVPVKLNSLPSSWTLNIWEDHFGVNGSWLLVGASKKQGLHGMVGFDKCTDVLFEYRKVKVHQPSNMLGSPLWMDTILHQLGWINLHEYRNSLPTKRCELDLVHPQYCCIYDLCQVYPTVASFERENRRQLLVDLVVFHNLPGTSIDFQKNGSCAQTACW